MRQSIKREPTAYVLDEQGNRIGTITHEFGMTNAPELMRRRWDGSWVQAWPEVPKEPGQHRSKARHRKIAVRR